jgi:hypothetical protein
MLYTIYSASWSVGDNSAKGSSYVQDGYNEWAVFLVYTF